MKSRLNITIDESLVEQAKNYAEVNRTSLSSLIEDSLRKIVNRQQPKKQSVLDIIKTLPKPTGNTEIYSTESYLEENKAKYGF
jgi:hypothetical protein